MSDIDDIVAALEKALEAQAIKDSDGSAPFMTRKQLRRLLDALKGAQAVILNGDGVVSAGVAINVQRRRAEEAEAKLSRAVELLSAVAEHGAVVYTSADGRVETLHGRIAAFLKEAP